MRKLFVASQNLIERQKHYIIRIIKYLGKFFKKELKPLRLMRLKDADNRGARELLSKTLKRRFDLRRMMRVIVIDLNARLHDAFMLHPTPCALIRSDRL